MAKRQDSGDPNWNLEAFREANAHWRSIFEQFYKHAGITFVLNGVLFTALSYTLSDQRPDANSDYAAVQTVIGLMASFIGIVFNLGAGIAFVRIWTAWRDIHQRGVALQNKLIDKDFRYYDVINLNGRRWVHSLTVFFYGVLTFGWVSLFVIIVWWQLCPS